MTELELIRLRSKLLAAEIETNGMIAENKQREMLGQSMAYTEQDFLDVMNEYGVRRLAVEEN